MSKMFAYINRDGESDKLTIKDIENITADKERAKEIWEYAKDILDKKRKISPEIKTEKIWYRDFGDGKGSNPRLIQVYPNQRTVIIFGYNFDIKEFEEEIERYKKGYKFRITTDSRLMKAGEDPKKKCKEMIKNIKEAIEKISTKYDTKNIKINCWDEEPRRWWCGEGTGTSDSNCYGYEAVFVVNKLWNKEKPSWNEIMGEINKIYAPKYERWTNGLRCGGRKKEIGIENIGESSF